MESPRGPQRVWYFFSDDLPAGELIMPVKTKYGLAFAVCRGKMEPEMLDQLNATADFVLSVGLAHLDGSRDMSPEREE